MINMNNKDKELVKIVMGLFVGAAPNLYMFENHENMYFLHKDKAIYCLRVDNEDNYTVFSINEEYKKATFKADEGFKIFTDVLKEYSSLMNSETDSAKEVINVINGLN